eukprot:SAG11_NODE_3542_length_2380_cov_1.640509_2_plen_148_part_00
MPDSASFRWSYYSSRLRSSIALAKHDGMEFSGYIVPRSSGGRDGGLLQRIMTLVGSGAKGVRYFDFGPECAHIFVSVMISASVCSLARNCCWIDGSLLSAGTRSQSTATRKSPADADIITDTTRPRWSKSESRLPRAVARTPTTVGW